MYLSVPTTSSYGKPGAFDPGFFRSIGMAAEESLEMSPVGFASPLGMALGIDAVRGAGVRFLELEALKRGDSRLLEPDEANEKYAIGDLSFSNPIREDAARYMRARHLKEMNRNQMRAYASQYGGTSRNLAMFASAFGAQLLDPVNFASMFVPVVGPGRAAAQVGKVAWWQRGVVSLEQLGLTAGTYRARAAEGLIEGAVGGAMFEPITAVQRRAEGFEYGIPEFVSAVGFSAALGAGLHTSLHALSRAFEVTPKTAHLVDEIATRQVMEGAAVRVADVLDAERRGVEPARAEEGVAPAPEAARAAEVAPDEPARAQAEAPDLMDLGSIAPETITDPKIRKALESAQQKRAEVERLRGELAQIEVPEKPKTAKQEFPEGKEKTDPAKVAEWERRTSEYRKANAARKRAAEALPAAENRLKQAETRARNLLRASQPAAPRVESEGAEARPAPEQAAPESPNLRRSAEAMARMKEQMEKPVTVRETLIGKPDQPIARNIEPETPEQQMADLAEEAIANRKLNRDYMTPEELASDDLLEASTKALEEMRRKLPEIAPCMRGKLNS